MKSPQFYKKEKKKQKTPRVPKRGGRRWTKQPGPAAWRSSPEAAPRQAGGLAGVWSAGFRRRCRHENYRVCTARPDAAIRHQAARLQRDGRRVWLRGSWALRRAPRSLAVSLQVPLGSWVRSRATGDGVSPGLCSGFRRATSLLRDPALSSQFGNLPQPGAGEAILMGSRAAAPTHGERRPLSPTPRANLGFDLSAQHSHRRGSLRRGPPPPARPADALRPLQAMPAGGHCNSIIELTLIWPILPLATSYGTQSPHCKQKGVPLSP